MDIGSGGGMDLLIAARRVGRSGRAIGVDPTPAMREAQQWSPLAIRAWRRVLLLEGASKKMPLRMRARTS